MNKFSPLQLQLQILNDDEYHDESVKVNPNSDWSYIPGHPYSIQNISGSGSGSTNALLNLIKHQSPNIDKIYFYVEDPLESKYQLLINGRAKQRTKELKKQKAFIDYLQTIDDVYKNLKDYNLRKKNCINSA